MKQSKIHDLRIIKIGLILVLGMLFLVQITGVADGVLLTNRAEKHQDNPKAIICDTPPDPTWRIPRPISTQLTLQPEQRRFNPVSSPQHTTLIYAPIHTPHTSSHSTRIQDQKSQITATHLAKPGNKQNNENKDSSIVPVLAVSVLEHSSSRIRPDGMDGHRIVDGAASVQVRPDGLGGYRMRQQTGNTARVRPDGLGGYRISGTKTGQQAQNASVRPDGMGGYRINNTDGSTHRVRPDGLGGYRVTGADGKVSRVRPDGLGGYRQR